MPNNNPIDWLKKWRTPKRETDIELPNDTGVRDPALPPPTEQDNLKRNRAALKGLIGGK